MLEIAYFVLKSLSMGLHESVRQARIDSGLSQQKVAKTAKVPRSQLQKLENGQNVTLDTFLKILSALPNLQRLSLGPTELQLKSVDVFELRDRLTDLISAAAAVLAAIEPAVRAEVARIEAGPPGPRRRGRPPKKRPEGTPNPLDGVELIIPR